MLRTLFNSLASVLAGPPPKAVGAQTEGPFLLSCGKGRGPTAGSEGQYLTLVSETTALFIPIISGDTKSTTVIFNHVTTTKALNNLAVELRRVQNIGLNVFCSEAVAR